MPWTVSRYRSANPALRSEWAYWRETARLYGFGRTELPPVKTNSEGLSRYVGKHIAKNIEGRREAEGGSFLRMGTSGTGKQCQRPGPHGPSAPKQLLVSRDLESGAAGSLPVRRVFV